MIDITNPAIPQIVGCVDTPGSATGVAILGTHAHVGDGDPGLHVIRLQCEVSSAVEMEVPGMDFCLLDAYPNPINPKQRKPLNSHSRAW